MKNYIQTPRGMSDLFGEQADYLLGLQDMLMKWTSGFNFEFIRTPVVENEKVFISTLGEDSDVIEKEMYELKKREGGEKYVLRPEGTASVTRAYLENGMHSWPQPVKLFYIAPMYRYERPQAGRYREHVQWGMEMIGSKDPICDAQIIQVIDLFLKKLKLSEYVLKVNSIGCSEDRKAYKKELTKYYRKHLKNMCEDCTRRYKTNPLRLLDCKKTSCAPFKEEAPAIVNHLCKDCEPHFRKFLEYLDDLEVNYELDTSLVRGFDYYTKTVFEIVFPEKAMSVGGGGRYDGLIKALGGKDTPAVGAAVGLERLAEVMQMHKIPAAYFKKPAVFLVQFSEEGRREAMKILSLLRKHNIPVSEAFSKTNLSSQLELANKIGIKFAIIMGYKEVGQKRVILKDMQTGEQETLPYDQLVEELKKKL